MKLPSAKASPALITVAVLAVVCLIQALPYAVPGFTFFQRLEGESYDWRVRRAWKGARPSDREAKSLAVIVIDEDSLKVLNKPDWGAHQWPWPRLIYGRLVQELVAQGAKLIGFDIFFLDRGHDYAEERMAIPAKGQVSSDEFFAYQLRQAGNVVLAAPTDATSPRPLALDFPLALFRTNALTVGHDGLRQVNPDPVFRRTPAFVDDPEHGRIWHLGIVLGAKFLGLDTSQAIVLRDRLVLRGPNGVERIIPVDRDRCFYLDWSVALRDVQAEPFDKMWAAALLRDRNLPQDARLQNKIVVIGSTGTGNNVADRGATPLGKTEPIFTSHWNVILSMLTGRFVRRASYTTELWLIVLMALTAAVLSWRLRAVWASLGVAAVALLYAWVGVWLYAQHLYWLPLVLPVAGALLMTHVCMVSYRMVVERTQRRLVRSTFGRLVSPNVFNLLVQMEPRALAGTRRRVTIYFADVRGFTRFTDECHARAEAYVRTHGLSGQEAEAFIDKEARNTLATVNVYLSAIADTVKALNGTLDKYIGDCVMAFWGAPVANDRHALSCVNAAVAVHRALHDLNEERHRENLRREKANPAWVAAGKSPLPLLPILKVGSAVHSGMVTAGFMGSALHISNYTVFGRDVNIASRLEHITGSDRILITQATYDEILRDAPEMTAVFRPLEPVVLRGIHEPMPIYEVPWQLLSGVTETEPSGTEASPKARPATKP